jgi:MYXO-CTERM domain-containing protein
VKLTAVAANEDMGVMTWLLGNSRAVPENYLSLELNEARINWFNAASNYESVVIEAADDAGGWGFVTEFAGPTAPLNGVVWQSFEQSQWDQFSTRTYGSFEEMFNASTQWSSYDGYWDAVRAAVTLPDGVVFEDFQLCPSCYATQVTYSPSELVAALNENVIEPMRVVQDLIDAHPQMTRLYSTLSATEMTLDPLFTFNPDLPEVSNVHQATRVIECNPSVYSWEAPWRIELPQGSVVRGTASQAAAQSWPAELGELPPNIRITRQSSSGEGRLLEDRTEDINTLLDDYNSTIPGSGSGGAGAGGTSAGTAGTSVGAGGTSDGSGGTGEAGDGAGGMGDAGGPGNEGGGEATGAEPGKIRSSGGGCAFSSGSDTRGLWALALFGAAAYVTRRRKPRVS